MNHRVPIVSLGCFEVPPQVDAELAEHEWTAFEALFDAIAAVDGEKGPGRTSLFRSTCSSYELPLQQDHTPPPRPNFALSFANQLAAGQCGCSRFTRGRVAVEASAVYEVSEEEDNGDAGGGEY